MKNLFYLLLLLVIHLPAIAQIPTGYYDEAEGLSADELKTALYNIIKEHKEFPYTSGSTDTWDILKETDKDPDNPSNVIGLYSGFSMDAAAEYNGGDGWTREHVWAKSRGDFGTTMGPGTDVHHLRPEDNSTNSARSNRTFAECNEPFTDNSGTYSGATGSYTSSSDFVWEPRAEVKGDVARMIFYMATRYEGENGEPDLEVVDYIVEQYSSLPEHGKLTDLLIWHEEDPVDDYERNRNDIIYGYQENRNPFIDHPEYVASIWGDVSGPFVSVDKSGFSADFGSVLFGQSFVQSYNLNGYNLEGDVTVTVDAPFYLSLDNTNFSNSVVLTHTADQVTESFLIYVKFEPQQSDAQTFDLSITHSSANMTDVVLEVSGQEGEATISSIQQARAKGLGTVVDVTGVILGGENNSSSSRVLYDGTAGIVIRSPDGETNETASLVIGDSVVVSGAITEYANLLQINGAPMSVTLISQNATLPEPKELTIDEISEIYESQLAVIKNVRFSDSGQVFKGGGEDGNFEITDGTGTLAFRIGNAGHPLVGTTIPSGLYDVVGYIGQFVDDYQITPRNVEDVTPVETDPTPEEIITISSARDRPEGEIVKVKGVVIGGENNNSINRIVFDGTAGLVVRGTDLGHLSSTLVMGDSVEVSGGILDYNGLFELEDGVKITVLNSGNSLPAPQEITLEDLGEAYESELIMVRGVSVSGSGSFEPGNYTLTDDSGTAIMRIGSSANPIVSMELPNGVFDLVGYVGQDGGDYQIFPRLTTDITNIIEVLANNAKQKSDMIYPNPAVSDVRINIGDQELVKVEVYNQEGKLVLEQLLSKSLNVSSLKKGLYFVLATTEEEVFYSKLIKQ
ncbi:MAG: endonuclease [Cyclobacteriaceae bacterium]